MYNELRSHVAKPYYTTDDLDLDLDLEVGRTARTHILRRFVPCVYPVRRQLVGTAPSRARWGLATLRQVESLGSLAPSYLLLFNRGPNVRIDPTEKMRVGRLRTTL